MLTTAETAQLLGYKHAESLRRAIRRCNLPLLHPMIDMTNRGRPHVYAKKDVLAQRKVMPLSGRPREGDFAPAQDYRRKRHIQPKRG